MCMICTEWELGKLTNQEALKNVGEAIESTQSQKKIEHLLELTDKILDKDMATKYDEPSECFTRERKRTDPWKY